MTARTTAQYAFGFKAAYQAIGGIRRGEGIVDAKKICCQFECTCL